MRYIFILTYLAPMIYACSDANITGVFPEIDDMSCSDYALMIGISSALTASLFWQQVTK